jgi:U6 snRNA-associated Sm-like protein LSm6
MLNTEVVFYNIGLLLSLDGHLNMALESVEELVNETVVNRYPQAFIRGNNGTFFLNQSFL